MFGRSRQRITGEHRFFVSFRQFTANNARSFVGLSEHSPVLGNKHTANHSFFNISRFATTNKSEIDSFCYLLAGTWQTKSKQSQTARLQSHAVLLEAWDSFGKLHNIGKKLINKGEPHGSARQQKKQINN